MNIFKKYRKSIVISSVVLASIVVIILVLQLIIGSIITNKIENAIDKREDNQYKITVGTVKINLFTMTLILKDLKVTPDSLYLKGLASKSVKQPDILRVKVPVLRIRNISILKLIRDKFIDVGSFVLKNAHIDVYTDGKTITSKDKKPKSSSALFNFDSIPLPGIGGGRIGALKINEFGINLINVNKGDTIVSANSLDLALYDVELLKNENDSTSFMLKLKDVDFNMSNETFYLPGGNYILSFKDMSFSMNKSLLVFDKLSIKPRYSRSKMVSLSKFQYEIYNVDIERIEINSIDLKQIIRESKFFFSSIDVDNMKLNIFKDKHFPFDESKRPTLPQQMLKALKKDLNIDSITISNSELEYSELHELMKEPMIVTLGNFNVKVKNITSVVDSMINGAVMTINLKANLQKTIPMEVDIAFPMKSIRDTFMFSGYLGKGEMKIFNPIVLPAIGVKFESGIIDRIDFKATANTIYSIGSMTMLYHDLEGDIQRKDMVETNKFLSWVANSVLIQNNPIKDNDPRTVPMYFERVMYKGLGNFLWKTLQSGITATIVPTMKSKVQGQIDVTKGTSNKDIRKREREEKKKNR